MWAFSKKKPDPSQGKEKSNQVLALPTYRLYRMDTMKPNTFYYELSCQLSDVWDHDFMQTCRKVLDTLLDGYHCYAIYSPTYQWHTSLFGRQRKKIPLFAPSETMIPIASDTRVGISFGFDESRFDQAVQVAGVDGLDPRITFYGYEKPFSKKDHFKFSESFFYHSKASVEIDIVTFDQCLQVLIPAVGHLDDLLPLFIKACGEKNVTLCD